MRKIDSRRVSRRGWSRRLGPWGILIFGGLFLALVPLVGCGGEEETTTTAAPTTGTTAVESTTTESTAPPEESTTTLFDIHSVTSSTEPLTSTTVTTEALSSAERRLPNGHIKAMGFITAVWESGGNRWITIDYAEMITDHDEATRRAREAGEIGPTEEWEYDYYISNVNPALRTFQVSNSVVITTSTRWVPGDDWEAPCTWADFKSFWGPGPFPESEQWLHGNPWWIERDGPIVVRIDEQYLP